MRLIVVDDEPELGRMVAEYLSRHGFIVRTATSGRELDALLASEPADLVILDVNMPGENGFAIARRLHTGPPILFLTAASDTVDRIVGLELGAEDYLTKPFDLRELRARIRVVLRRTDRVPPAAVASPARTSQQANSPLPAQEIRLCTAADGVRIACATVGGGPPLIRPANWMTHLEYDWDSPVWRHWLVELSRHHCLIRYDGRATGLSDREVADLSFEALVSDLVAVVETLGVTRFPLLGISQGCAVAIAYAVRYPDRVSQLILCGGYASGWAMRGSPDEEAHRRALTSLILRGWGQDNPAFRQVFTSLFIPDATPEQMQWFNDLQRITASPENAYRMQHVFGGIQVSDLLPLVRTPTLVLHARHDGVVPFEQGRLLAAGIPGARFVPLESRNHLLLEGEPAWRKFLQEMRAFLRVDGGGLQPCPRPGPP
jgi:pimeloyl-ACP methyl ester carboxylesterase/CheY-like chemotaxis protein